MVKSRLYLYFFTVMCFIVAIDCSNFINVRNNVLVRKEISNDLHGKIYHIPLLLDNKDNCRLHHLSTDMLLQFVWYSDVIDEPCYVTIQPQSKYESYTPFCMEIKAKNIPCKGNFPLITYKTRLDNYRFHEGTIPCTSNIEQERCFSEKTSLTVIFSSMIPKPKTSSFSVRFYTHRTNTVDNSACSFGWKVFGDHCYYFGRDLKNWTNAKEFCEESGSILVRIETPEENEWIYNHQEKDMWTGGIRSFYDDFIWYDNREDMLYTNWNFMEPSNRYDNEDCMLLLVTNSGKWNDRKCSIKAEFICEKNI
ncbi:aggrecan core protein-like isoform X2 [Mytilus californianus]|uniref:aggrecan core protein-like isoform X2 n=1 Tax=Mytilus californianus TaxID=6549 RepID=UPI0022455A65|nr:aggrecan core protein-like isoform X2 [Mytilus californianus]